MGYWEQIGVENIKERRRRARMHPLQRALKDTASSALLWVACIAIWALILLSVALPALRGFFD